jgi:hypothetical protein
MKRLNPATQALPRAGRASGLWPEEVGILVLIVATGIMTIWKFLFGT